MGQDLAVNGRLILFRTDGSHAQGMGDVCGSLALAHAFRSSGIDVLFLINGDAEAMALIREDGFHLEIVDAGEGADTRELALIQQYRPDAIVVNRLNNPAGYLQSLKTLSRMLVVLDDNGPEARVADVNINVLYHLDGAVSDPRYIALREEFQHYHRQERAIPEVISSILVTQGGSDTYGFTPMIVTALKSIPGNFLVTVVTGWAFRHFAHLEAALQGDQRFRVVHGTKDMAGLMTTSDLAITGGGNTMFELACVGTPAIVVCAEEFEVETARRLAAEAAVINLGFGGRLGTDTLARAARDLMDAPQMRRHMSTRGKELVDGQGSQRIAQLVREKLTAMELNN